jgi:hypothetical protein
MYGKAPPVTLVVKFTFNGVVPDDGVAVHLAEKIGFTVTLFVHGMAADELPPDVTVTVAVCAPGAE